ncbi:YfhJ family protein [Priestia megaterium]|uniref:YfhJ family protein n=1 Tax=Priestia megaterium TaxID=1404 RepID=UPI0013E3EF8B|nr:YfhJ family protein [Priestia megaterium]MED3865338.1 YfhJ family protein [Priestia megaterium]MED4102989.1 YfhJ family protein [Priestia megaterium]MED4146455.1 YfhJ family protein [Priestia megaterium]MED4168794.1 YfhJ family protein [Priestia megaterium]MED4201645.1 YfhJ family protein [Priestia megaterium]
MNDTFERLTNQLLSKNSSLSYAQARTWVELFWEDFESSYAKAGYDYKGKEATEKVVKMYINSYGDKLHEIAVKNPKYQHLLNNDDYLKH